MKFTIFLALISSVASIRTANTTVATTPPTDAQIALLPVCTGTNGPLNENCKAVTCTGTNGPRDGGLGTPCVKEEVTSIPHYNIDPKAGRPFETTGDLTNTKTTAPGVTATPMPNGDTNTVVAGLAVKAIK